MVVTKYRTQFFDCTVQIVFEVINNIWITITKTLVFMIKENIINSINDYTIGIVYLEQQFFCISLTIFGLSYQGDLP